MDKRLWHLQSVRSDGLNRPRLNDVTVSVPQGITSVVGWSGAGKTTLLNLLVGYELPDAGKLESALPNTNGRMPLFWSPDDHGLWPHLTVRDHLKVVSSGGSFDAEELLKQFDLLDQADAHPDSLSQGQSSRLATARTLAADPAVLVMDEPLEHVDPARLDRYWQVIRDHLKTTGVSLVFSTHSPQLVLAHAEHVICLSEGSVIYQGPVDSLYHQPENQQQALCLGHTNWMEPDQAKCWLNMETDRARSIRPHQLDVEPDPENTSPVVVESSTFVGAVCQAELKREATDGDQDQTRTFWHRPGGKPLQNGQRVLLKILSVWFLAMSMFLFSGCQKGGDPKLHVDQVNIWNMPAKGRHIPGPRGVCIGPDDKVVTLDNGGRVLIFDAEGKLLRKWDMPTNEAGNAEGACWLRDGRIAVADTHYHRIVFFDQEGRIERMLGEFGEDGKPGTFIYPVSIVQDDNENIYVAEYGGRDRVQKFDKDGKFLLSFGELGLGPGQFQRAGGMVWYQGRIYVTDTANARIQVFDEQGKFLGIVGHKPVEQAQANQGTDAFQTDDRGPQLLYPYDVEIGPDGAMYVIEWGANRVTKMSLDGKVLGRFGEPGTGSGQFRRPWGIAVDSKMRVRIADTENRRIVELRL